MKVLENKFVLALACCLAYIAAFLIVTALFGCGYQRTLREHCHIGDTQTCDNLFGVNQAAVDEAQTSQLAQQQKQIDSLTTMMQELRRDLANTEADYNQTSIMINLLHTMAQSQGADIDTINQMLVDMNQDLASLEEKIAYEQVRINALAIDVEELQNQGSDVVESVYPCGDAPGKFDEALLRLNSGKLIAYFEANGSNRFLTELNPGGYRTTDYAPYCHFSVDNELNIVNASRRK